MIDLEKQKEVDENVRKTFNRFKREAIKIYGAGWEYESKATLVNVIYSKVLDSDKFEDFKQYDFLLKSDRFDNGKDKIHQLKQVIENRFEYVSDELTLKLDREAIKKNKATNEQKDNLSSSVKLKL